MFAPHTKLTVRQSIAMALVPAYWLRPVYIRSAFVRERIPPDVTLGYFLRIEFDDHRDAQTLYPSGWQKRTATVRVSKRLYMAEPVLVQVFCQYSRIVNNKTAVRCWMAR